MKKSSGSANDTNPIQGKEDIQKNPDEHIDQDFPGYPHSPSHEKTINPKTNEDKANARLMKKDSTNDEQNSDGSANAFSESENDVLRGELDDDNEKNY